MKPEINYKSAEPPITMLPAKRVNMDLYRKNRELNLRRKDFEDLAFLPTAYVVRGKVMFSVCPHLGGGGGRGLPEPGPARERGGVTRARSSQGTGGLPEPGPAGGVPEPGPAGGGGGGGTQTGGTRAKSSRGGVPEPGPAGEGVPQMGGTPTGGTPPWVSPRQT